jgi:hypothetical protein
MKTRLEGRVFYWSVDGTKSPGVAPCKRLALALLRCVQGLYDLLTPLHSQEKPIHDIDIPY